MKSIIGFLQTHGAWAIPLIALVGSGMTYIINYNLTHKYELAILRGRVTNINLPVRIAVDSGGEITKTTNDIGFYRIEKIMPGTHEFSIEPTGSPKRYLEINVKPGTEQTIDIDWNKLESSVNAGSTPRETDSNIHNWYAGTTYRGQVDMMKDHGFIWNCSGGTCKLSGPYGEGLSMKVCQELVNVVGKIDYYYNDVNMSWSKNTNSDKLEQCNTPSQNIKPENHTNPDAFLLSDFNSNRIAILDKLILPIKDCLLVESDAYPIFHGCIDWHSSTHAIWSLLRYERVTKNTKFASIVDTRLNPSNISKELSYLKSHPDFEIPYGRAWFLLLATEYKKARKNDELKEMADFVADSLVEYITKNNINPLDKSYLNPSWVLINLYDYALFSGNDKLKIFVIDYSIKNMEPALKQCLPRDDFNSGAGFISTCGNLAYLLAKIGEADTVADWANNLSNEDGEPIIEPSTVHEKGLNFSRAWAFNGLYIELGDPVFQKFFMKNFIFQFSHTDFWRDSYSVSHWVPQFGIYALTLDFK